MRHLLMHPAFPDIVGQWAAQQTESGSDPYACVNYRNHRGVAEPVVKGNLAAGGDGGIRTLGTSKPRTAV